MEISRGTSLVSHGHLFSSCCGNAASLPNMPVASG
jgi:hypothetical protein